MPAMVKYCLHVIAERTIATGTHGRYLVAPADIGPPTATVVGFHGYAEEATIQMARLRELRADDPWTLVSIQALHRFYRGDGRRIAASWMTREDRELIIGDNVAYVDAVVREIGDEFQNAHRTSQIPKRQSQNGERRTNNADRETQNAARRSRNVTRGMQQANATMALAFAGFSQGASMAYRAAALGRFQASVIAVGGDLPPELGRELVRRIPRVLIGWGTRDSVFTREIRQRDEQRLRDAGVDVSVSELDAGHEWTGIFSESAREWLRATG
jgi:predicted esterase